MGQGDREVGLAHPDRAVDTEPFAGGDELQAGQVADLGRGQFRVVGEVETFERCGAGQVGGPQAPGHRRRFSACQLILAQDLEELEVAESAGPGLGQAGVEGLEHPGQLERAQHRAPGRCGARSSSSPLLPERPGASQPRRGFGAGQAAPDRSFLGAGGQDALHRLVGRVAGLDGP